MSPKAATEEKAEPTQPCPTCRETPGRVFDRDASGGHFDDCPDCGGTGRVRDLATKALELGTGGKPVPAAAAK